MGIVRVEGNDDASDEDGILVTQLAELLLGQRTMPGKQSRSIPPCALVISPPLRGRKLLKGEHAAKPPV